MFILGMVAMYFLLNLVVVVALLIKERKIWKKEEINIRVVIKQLVRFLFLGTPFAIIQALDW